MSSEQGFKKNTLLQYLGIIHNDRGVCARFAVVSGQREAVLGEKGIVFCLQTMNEKAMLGHVTPTLDFNASREACEFAVKHVQAEKISTGIELDHRPFLTVVN